MNRRLAFGLVLGLASFWTSSAMSQSADDRTALSGLKEVKIVFDLTNGDAKSLSGTLDVIAQTRESLIRQGVVPQIVLAFRGPATKLVQTDQTLIDPKDRKDASKIAETIKSLRAARGIVGMEQCGIAAKSQGVKPEAMLPGIKVVGNGWISLAAYQTKGFAYISP